MPQLRGVLNAFAFLRRRAALACGRPEPGLRLDPASFLAHAAALARAAPSPPGLWLSLICDPPQTSYPSPLMGEGRGGGVPRLRSKAWRPPSPTLPREGGGGAAPAAEYVVCDSRLDPAQRFAEAVGRARAPYVARLDAAGRLAPFAAERIAAALAAHPQAEALYSDEILTDARGRPAEVVLKPAFDPVLLDGFDYFGRLAVYRRDTVLALGAPADDYELALRVAARAPKGAILHLPYPAHLGPPRLPDPDAAATLRRARGLATAPGLVADRLRPVLPSQPRAWPKVSVVIPSRDAPEMIGETLAGLFERTDYPDFDVTIIDNGSADPATLAIYDRWRERLRVERKPAPFNFSRAVNRGAALSDGPLLLLLNNDIEVIEPGWLKEMAAGFEYADVGVVGAKLLYPDKTLQHAGVIAGLGGYAGHWHIGRPESELGSQRRLAARQSLSVVTAACMLASRACFERLGGFDEETFPIAYNDVDFCLRAGAAGFRVLWTPFARLIHHESVSRGSDETETNRARFERDKAALRARHRTDVLEDRAYNPWAVRSHSDPWPVARKDLPPAR